MMTGMRVYAFLRMVSGDGIAMLAIVVKGSQYTWSAQL